MQVPKCIINTCIKFIIPNSMKEVREANDQHKLSRLPRSKTVYTYVESNQLNKIMKSISKVLFAIFKRCKLYLKKKRMNECRNCIVDLLRAT